MKSEKGQSIVETALIIPIVIALLFGIADFGRAFHAYLTLEHAGREGARLATVGANIGEIEERIKEVSVGVELESGDIVITPEPDNPDDDLASGSEVSIEITYEFTFITPFLNILTSFYGDEDDDEPSEGIPLKSKTVMRVE